MKITGVELYPVAVLCLHPGGPTSPDIRKHAVVKVLTDSGLVGVGEITGKRGLPDSQQELDALLRDLNGALVGLDPSNTVLAHQILIKLLSATPLANPVRCGIDIALHDLAGKAMGVSVGQLLGGVIKPQLPIAYPIPAHRSEHDISASIDYMQEMLDRGFTRVRFYIGLNLEADAKCLTIMRDRFGANVTIKTLDCNFHMDWRDALAAIERFSEYGIEFVESPARKGDVEGVASVRRAVNYPISDHAYSLSEALALIRASAVDILNITTVSAGGIREGQKIASLAEAAGISCVLGAAHEMSIGTAAQAHLGSTMINLDYPSDAIGPEIYNQDVVSSPIDYANGNLIVPSGPGIGLELDDAKLASLSMADLELDSL